MNSITNSLRLLALIIISCHYITHSLTITQADIDSGLIIDQPGTWELIENLTFTTPYAIIITSTGVSLNLNNYSIRGDNLGQVAIQISNSDCHILNGTIENSTSTAIEISQSSGVSIENITYQNCSASISVLDSEYTNIASCTVIHSENTAISVNNSPYTTLKNITITECLSDCVVITGTSNSSFLNQIQVSHSTGTNGIKISSDMITLKGIVAFSLAGNALAIEGNNVEMCFASIGLNNGHGCIISGSETHLQQCSFSKNNGDGILLQATSTNTSIINSLSSGNSHIGINNLGANSNQLNSTLCCNNGVRDLWRIINN